MITIENICFGYKKRELILSDLSLLLAKGSAHGLLGANGTGKTTLMKLMSGLLLPGAGRITVEGHTPGDRRPAFFSEIFLIPEEFDLPNVTFDSFVKHNSAFYPNFSQELLATYAAELGVNRKARLGGISMGERKKAYLAFALACQPTCLFMDEPTNGLDIPSKSAFKSIIASFISPERTVVISTHQVGDIQNIIDNVIIMDKEGIVLNETIENISRRLRFGVIENGIEPIWSKESLAGRSGVAVNTDGKTGVVDLEMLFNAATNDKRRVTDIFKH